MLRGGGACTSQTKQQSLSISSLQISNQFENVLSSNVLLLSKSAEDFNNNYSQLYNSLQILLSLDQELYNLTKSRNQLNKQVESLEKWLTEVLESCLKLKNPQLRYLALQFAQKLSRTIFWYYCQSKSIKDRMQQQYISTLNKIETQNNASDSFYKNMIEYEIMVCKMIFVILPNDLQEGLEVMALFTSYNQILMTTLPKSTQDTIKSGVVQSIRDATKVQYRKIYKQIFNIDTMKWWVIQELRQSNHSAKEIITELHNFHKDISKSDYYVHYAWIQAVSDIVSYAPLISEDHIQIINSDLQDLIDMGCLQKIKNEYRVTFSYIKMKNQYCQQIYEKIPIFTMLKQIQSQIITQDKFFNSLYKKKEEQKESQKQELETKNVFEYLFQLFVEIDIEANIDLIKKANQSYHELNENITLIKQLSLNKWIRMLEKKSYDDPVVFGEFEEKQKQIKHLINQVKGIQRFLIHFDYILLQWNIMEQIASSEGKQTQLQSIFLENQQNYLDCHLISKANLENLKDIQLLNINFDVYFSIITEFIEKQYQTVIKVVQTTRSTDPIISLYKQNKDITDIVQNSLRKVNDKIIQFKNAFMRISLKLKQVDYNCIQQFYLVSLRLQYLEFPNQQFEFRNQDHKTLFFIQGYEKQIIKSQLIELHKEFRELFASSQFQDYEQAKVYIRSIQFISKTIDNLINQNKKIIQHIHNYKLSLQIDYAYDYYNDLINQWNTMFQMAEELDYQKYDQSFIQIKYDELKKIYEYICQINTSIRWPVNPQLASYFKMQSQLEGLIQELQIYQSYNLSQDLNSQIRYQSIITNIKQICLSQVQKVKSILEQYTQGVDQLSNRLENQTNFQIEELQNLLLSVQEALDDTLNLVQSRLLTSNQNSTSGSINVLQSNKKQDFETFYNYKFSTETIIVMQFIKFNFNFIDQNAILEILKSDENELENLHIVQSAMESPIIRSIVIVNLMNVWNCCLVEEDFDTISKLILQIRINETNVLIKREIKSTYKKEFNQIVNNSLQGELAWFELDLKQMIQERNSLYFQIKYEPTFELSQKLEEKINKLTNQIQTRIQNFQELEQDYNISIPFSIKVHNLQNYKRLAFIKETQLLNYFYQGWIILLEKQKQPKLKILMLSLNAKTEAKIKLDYYFSQKEKRNSTMDRFLDDLQQDRLLLLQGESGSGKSLATKMIEEYVWKRNDPIKIIPIIIKLSELKDPINNAIIETLRSLNYKLNVSQIEQLQAHIRSNKMQMLFIFQGYDKLNQNQKSINFLKSNNLIQWNTPCLQNTPKYIVVSRSEQFKNPNHLRWIDQNEENYKIKNYWNLKILPFDTDQINQFLIQFQEISIRNVVMDFYQLMCEFPHQDLLIYNFISFWKKINFNFNEQSLGNVLLSQPIINKLIITLQQDTNIKNFKGSITQQLSLQLGQLKSSYYYSRILETLQFDQSIDNPQILKVFIYALPKLILNLSDLPKIKNQFFNVFFTQNYQSLCDISEATIDLENHWNQLVNSQFFKMYNLEYSVAKAKLIINQLFLNDKALINKLIQAFEKIQITHYDLYEEYMNYQFDKSVVNFELNEQGIDLTIFRQEQWNFSLNFAQQLAINELFSIKLNNQNSSKAIGSVSDLQIILQDDIYQIKDTLISKRYLRNSIPLREQFSVYSFESKIIQEFLVAKVIIQQIEQVDHVPKNELFDNTIIKMKNVSNPFYIGTVNFIVQKLKSNFHLKQKLMKMIQLSSSNVDYCQLSSNAFYLLMQLDGSIRGGNLMNVKLKDIVIEDCYLQDCNLSGSEWNNITVKNFSLIKNNMSNMTCKNLKLASFFIKNTLKSPLFVRIFQSGQIIIVYKHSIQDLFGNLIINGTFQNCQIYQIGDDFYITTENIFYLLRETNNKINSYQFDIQNVISVTQFDQYIMLLQLMAPSDAKIFQLNPIKQEIQFRIPILLQDIIKYNIKQFYDMQGNLIVFLTQTLQVQSMHYQIEGGQLSFDNLTFHTTLNNIERISSIKYYQDLDITVVTKEIVDAYQEYDVIYGTFNQLIGKFIVIENQKKQFLYLNNTNLQLISQETFKMISECELYETTLNLKKSQCYLMNHETMLLTFQDSFIILSLQPFEVIKQIKIQANDLIINSKYNYIQILTECELLCIDITYAQDRQDKIINSAFQLDSVYFIQNSCNFLGKMSKSEDIYIVTLKKGIYDFKNLGQSDNSQMYLSNDENYAIFSKNKETICYDLKSNIKMNFVALLYDRILWIKDNQNFFYLQHGFIEEFRNSLITVKNKIINKQSSRQIKSAQSTEKRLFITTNTNETIVLNQKFQQEYVTTKYMIKKYREFYITNNDLRYESNVRNTITIIYDSKNKIKDFWIFTETILIREQEDNNEMSTLVLLRKLDNCILAQIQIQIDHIAYTDNMIQIISNRILWLTYSAKDFYQLQSNILLVNQIQMSSNSYDQVAIVSAFSEITFWSTITYQVLQSLKNVELIQYFKMIPNKDRQFYVADRDVLKLYNQNQVRFTIQLIKKRIQIVTNTWGAIHHIYQVEEDKITLNSMNEDSKIINWKKVVFELDSNREQIDCIDNKDQKLIYFSGQKLQLSNLDSFDIIKSIPFPETFKAIQIKYNQDCSLIILRSNDKVIIIEALELKILNSISLNEIFPQFFEYASQLEIFIQGQSNLILKQIKDTQNLIYTYSLTSKRLDLITLSNNELMIGPNSQGLVIIDKKTGSIQLYHPIIIETQFNSISYIKTIEQNKSMLAKCQLFGNQLINCNITLNNQINISDIWRNIV
ncbi:unnamed protein product (macronuclear) [Paramecium tetraurelia]|uniref:NACHT domain-containing protein n=1 Tax=Paramecium tetraurelia TaxID=5888 RepID=A0D6U1_PARTE|nr:uncharacterized protein GSPATT00001799001 [Paramecium tetraurelia]CAK78758.1 unnamed protein product [Paramecium tetraurelia]|eukprot:XP_001446155.1 hypothetical protein (macronuclear) [Paramecium tetraurelia strain d4-2]